MFIQQPLVKYRRHDGNVSFFAGGDDTTSFAHRENRLRWVDEQTVRAYDNMLADCGHSCTGKGRLTSAERDRLSKEGRRIRTIYAVERQMMDGNILKRLSTLAGAAGRGNFKCALRFLPRLLPQAIYRALYQFRNRNRPASRRRGGLMEVPMAGCHYCNIDDDS